MARRLQISEKRRSLLLREWPSFSGIEVVSDFRSCQAKLFADGDGTLARAVHFRISHAVPPIISEVAHWKIGGDVEVTNHRHPVFLWHAEPHPQRLGTFGNLYFEIGSHPE